MTLPDDALELAGGPAGLRQRLLGTIAEVNVLRVLPAVLDHLHAMRHYVGTVAEQVTAMNASVSQIEPGVRALNERVDGIERTTENLAAAMARLEGHMRELDRSLHP